MEETIFRWVNALGFPIVAAVAMGIVGYRLGLILVKAHARFLEATVAQQERFLTETSQQMQSQTQAIEALTVIVQKVLDSIPNICRQR